MPRRVARSILLASLVAACGPGMNHEVQPGSAGAPSLDGTADTTSWVGASVAATAAPMDARARAVALSKIELSQAVRPEEADELIVVGQSSHRDRAANASRRAPTHDEGSNILEGVSQGTLRARDTSGKVLGDFPLRRTEVKAEISGFLARTVVEQTYVNPFESAIEAVYVFPMPSLAAVNDFVMQIGSRRIVGIVRPREEAERIYQQARARGQTASLLTQERPNIFTQNVANIEAGGTVRIRITYFERLKYEHGEYAYVFPMVVGPRYISGAPQVAQGSSLVSTASIPQDGGGWSPPTDRVPDADRITPPVLEPGQRSGHDIGLTVTLDAGLPITNLTSPAHRVVEERETASRRVLRLASNDSIPNRDFVLRWSVAGAETQFGVLAHRGESGGYFTLTMQPPREPSDDQVTAREITFILDVSGSMGGLPIEISRELVKRSLDELRPDDRFNLVYFASGNGQLWERARPRTSDNVAEAKRFLARVQGGGGTEMMAGIRRALAAHHDPELIQMFVFLTDGYVGEDQEILRVVKDERGDARFFAFGIGSSVNRFLIDGVGEHGGGGSHVVIPRDPEHASVAVRRLFDMIDSPVLVDVAIDWNGLPVRDVYPARVRDLFAGQTISVLGRFEAPAQGTAYVTGRVGARRVRYPVTVELPEARSENAALAPAWARHRIAELSSELLGADADRTVELTRQITELAIRHRLVSRFTSFVAVDESRVVGDGRPMRILQPVEMPEGVSYEGVFGEPTSGRPVRISSWGVTLQETASGKVRVAEVSADGPAARAGMRAGGALSRVNRIVVSGLEDLERVLLQAGRSVLLRMEEGVEITLPSP
ncbi:MAG TPA: VIT domain-containing protein [Gemmatimonadaceae bacterium]|nr:VIT domain-containing protein [Gemmatimonadaceae bacterium]